MTGCSYNAGIGLAYPWYNHRRGKHIGPVLDKPDIMIPEENDATICMFEKLLYEDQNQENTAYTKRLIIDQDFDL